MARPDDLDGGLQDLSVLLSESRQRALEEGVLEPIPFRLVRLPSEHGDFEIRVVEDIGRLGRSRSRSPRDPFAPPYEPSLLVADMGTSHVCLLNKYPLLFDHALLVTRRRDAQESRLTEDDFRAAWIGLASVDGIVFYNWGPKAGASQGHKHLQLVPLPLTPGERRAFPLAPVFRDAIGSGGGRVAPLRMVHRIAALSAGGGLEAASRRAFACYRNLCQELEGEVGGVTEAPHNLLFTRRWLMVVPRRAGDFEGISVNALGFIGALMARGDDELERIRRLGPVSLLAAVGFTGG